MSHLEDQPELQLHTYFRSSCSARVRIALHHKGLDFKSNFIHLLKNDQKSAEYTKLNPSGTVPTLTVLEKKTTTSEGNAQPFVITQSTAILEYLEERFPTPKYPALLPPAENIQKRATIRALASIIGVDIQPLSNLKIQIRIKKLAEAGGQDPAASAQQWGVDTTMPGLKAFEKLASSTFGKYSVGDEVTLADVYLIPAVDNALRIGIDLEKEGLDTIAKVVANLRQLDAFKKGGWQSQPDTPEELQEK